MHHFYFPRVDSCNRTRRTKMDSNVNGVITINNHPYSMLLQLSAEGLLINLNLNLKLKWKFYLTNAMADMDYLTKQ